MGRMTLITGGERRRRWSFEERARILAAIDEPGAVVAEAARRADVCTSLVYKWRREARSAASASGFAPVIVENTPQSPSPASEPELDAIVAEMKDARIRIGANAPSTLIAATLKALRSIVTPRRTCGPFGGPVAKRDKENQLRRLPVPARDL
jgi:transposase